MFSEELNKLIHASLEDGVLEEHEKNALIKRATAEGVDLVELEIYVNSILQRRQRELNDQKIATRAALEQKKNEAFGKTCPQCGKQIESMTLRCECGYEFRYTKPVSSVQQLYEKLNNIQFTDAEIQSCSEEVKENRGEKEGRRVVKDAKGNVVTKINKEKLEKLRKQKQHDLIATFPVPNTKEDIIEFLALAAPKSKLKGGIFATMKGQLTIVIPVAIITFLLVTAIATFITFDIENGAATGCLAAMVLVAVCLIYGSSIINENKEKLVWKEKFNQVLMKGRSLRADADFARMLDYYEQKMK